MSRVVAERWPQAPAPVVTPSAAPAGASDGFTPIDDYGVIGDSGTAALVSSGGSIDWLCLPNVDSDPVFGAILDPARGGRWTLRPREPVLRVERRYEPGTAVLATRYVCASGVATVHDLLAVTPSEDRRGATVPFRYLVRRVTGERGSVAFETVFEPRRSFGGRAFAITASGRLGAATVGGRAVYVRNGGGPLRADGSRLFGALEVEAGETVHVALSYAERDLGVAPPVGAYAEEAFRSSLAYWRRWSGSLSSDARLSPLVARSLMVLKLLTFAPSGGVVAAVTTSLPEAPGAGRNWDYRYVWVRDASRAVIALSDHGHAEEARAYLLWLLNAASLTQPGIRTLYDVFGRPRAREREIPGLRGYRDSRPVRRGNAAIDQLQLDNWGYLVEAIDAFARIGGEVDDAIWRSARAYVDHVARVWSRPDHGIWEVRAAPEHYVHSKVMAWVALDRGLRLSRDLGLLADRERWASEAERLRSTILDEGYDRRGGTFVTVLGGDDVDAALLELASAGILEPDDPRLARTIDRVRSELGVGPLVYRYRRDDGLAGVEGAFVPCSFWLADALARTGRRDEALEVFRGAAALASDLGLLPEEVDPSTGAALGNFPQGLSHIALVNAAAAIRSAGQPSGR